MNFIVNKYQGNVKLLLVACDEDEQKFLESHIGEIVELHAAQHSVQRICCRHCGKNVSINDMLCSVCGTENPANR